MRLATVVGPAYGFGWEPRELGTTGGHIYQIIAHDNHPIGNSGLLLWMDVVIPLASFLFLALARPTAAGW